MPITMKRYREKLPISESHASCEPWLGSTYARCEFTLYTAFIKLISVPVQQLVTSLCIYFEVLNKIHSIYIRQISLYLQSQPCVLFLKYSSLTFSHDMFGPFPGHHQVNHKHSVLMLSKTFLLNGSVEGIDLFVVYIL
jgi:hypothetical protein